MTSEEMAAPTEPPPYYASEAPDCGCKSSVPWERRRYDGTWNELSLEQRTCLECGFSLTREIT